ncbi:TetR family transcriptional regulator [Nonomuraea africana]|uniref:AcrR family transcriptional regulator n=1 Tax=Nonomuraea africana TaxID=46171 RepID=A0ABR9KRF9_9ACTN|nr:TetR family transcriptional regulator [Nonomuraea africana]MBE1564604.1 AcrR family transcriptional regulator [Nonomuraea africana]
MEARLRDREATRERLLAAARALFAEHGYEQVTVRMIAAAADANIALVGRYFGSKAGLFGEVLAGEPTVRQVLEGDLEGLPRRLGEYAAQRMRAEPESPILRTLERSAGDPEIQALLSERLRTAVVNPLVARLEGDDGDDAMARARMATAVFLGVGSVRRLLGPSDPSSADVDRLTAVFEACLRARSDLG